MTQAKKEATQGVKVRGATANCGNDTLGEKACTTLTALAKETGVLVINCQEVDFNKTLGELEPFLQENNLRIEVSELFQTVTKLEALNKTTGIATLIIYDPTKIAKVNFTGSKTARDLNKGALISTVEITTQTNKTCTIKTVSGHLDAKKEESRSDQWKAIREKLYPEADSWTDLVAVVPDAVFAGYDANIRLLQKTSSTGATKAVNPWLETEKTDGHIATLALSPIGTLTSAPLTYNKGGASEKRPGYQERGSLDFDAIQNNTQSTSPPSPSNSRFHTGITIGLEEGTDRDHVVVVSEETTIDEVDEFTLIRNHIAKQLEAAAPELSRELMALEMDTPNNRILLLAVDQKYLQPDGLLQKEIAYNEQKIGLEDVPCSLREHSLYSSSNSDILSKLPKAPTREHSPDSGLARSQKDVTGESSLRAHRQAHRYQTVREPSPESKPPSAQEEPTSLRAPRVAQRYQPTKREPSPESGVSRAQQETTRIENSLRLPRQAQKFQQAPRDPSPTVTKESKSITPDTIGDTGTPQKSSSPPSPPSQRRDRRNALNQTQMKEHLQALKDSSPSPEPDKEDASKKQGM